MNMNVEQIAAICHEANRRLCQELGDLSQVAWPIAPPSIRASACVGVETVIADPGIAAEDLHEEWRNFKQSQGWTYGPVKNDSLKLHPCLVDFDKLPPEQQAKDELFIAIVNALAPLLELSQERAA